MTIISGSVLESSSTVVLLRKSNLGHCQGTVRLCGRGITAGVMFDNGVASCRCKDFPFSSMLPCVLGRNVPVSIIVRRSGSLGAERRTIRIMQVTVAGQ